MEKVFTFAEMTGLEKFETWRTGWQEPESIDIFSYVGDVVSPEDCLIFCKWLFPDFVVFEDSVILAMKFDEAAFHVWLDHCSGDKSGVERMLNHTHLYDVFSGCGSSVNEAVFEQLSKVLAMSWRMVLKDRFPDRTFQVEAINSDQEYGPVVVFHQVRVSGE
ncbi:hypothetical protein [Pseudomonas sp. MWU13-3659]|uniref:hypothetical protein n=1 Tax=Pseudomonas sp. MWU13-3659 TaxID=2986964 RepID=UPI002074ECA7|nr:hypothetical protein [Pseudomonas sp. MWU13-3659]